MIPKSQMYLGARIVENDPEEETPVVPYKGTVTAIEETGKGELDYFVYIRLDDESMKQKRISLCCPDKIMTCFPWTIASAYSESDYLIEAKEYFEKVYQINPKYEDVTEKLSVLCLMHGEIDNFFKYNKECEHPLEEDMILDLLNSPEHREEDERTLKEVWERMKKENKKKTKGKK